MQSRSDERKYVLLLANTDTALNGFLVLSKLIYERTHYCPAIFCEGNLRIDELIQRNNIDVNKVIIVHLPSVKKEKQSFLQKVYNYIEWRLKKNVLGAPLLIHKEMRVLKQQKKVVEEIFDKYHPITLIIYTDRRGGYEQVAVSVAKLKNIPVVIPAVSKVYVQQFFNNSHNGIYISKMKRMPLLYAIMKKINNKWVMEVDDAYVFFKTPFECLPAYFMKMCNMNPWVLGATEPTLNANADLDSYYETIQYLGKDITSKTLAYTTSVEESLILESKKRCAEVKREINQKYNVQADTIIIFSAVPYFEAGVSTLEINKKIYYKLVSCLSKLEAHIIVSLHPKMDRFNYDLQGKFNNVTIADEPLRDILCCADLYVGMEKSATCEWAGLLEIESLLLPEKWFREYDEKEIDDYFRHYEQHLCKKNSQSSSFKLDFLDLLFQVFEGEDISMRIRKQFIRLNKS